MRCLLYSGTLVALAGSIELYINPVLEEGGSQRRRYYGIRTRITPTPGGISCSRGRDSVLLYHATEFSSSSIHTRGILVTQFSHSIIRVNKIMLHMHGVLASDVSQWCPRHAASKNATLPSWRRSSQLDRVLCVEGLNVRFSAKKVKKSAQKICPGVRSGVLRAFYANYGRCRRCLLLHTTASAALGY